MLVGLFEGVDPPPGNRHPYRLCFALFGLLELVGLALLLILPRNRWIFAQVAMQAPLLYLGFFIPWFNGRVYGIWRRCPCGTPA